MIRAAVIGLGQMGRNHARVLSGDVAGVELVCAVDELGDRFGALRGLPVYRGIDEMLRQDIDYAVIAVPTISHVDVALQLADAGMNVLIEKPLADNPKDAARLAEAFSAGGLVAGVGHVERYNPALRQLRSRLDDQLLGSIYQVVTRRQGPFPARISDVGVVADLATHDVDLTAWLARSAYRSVSAQVAHQSGREHEDLVVAVGSLESGVITSHQVNWLSPFKERVTMVLGERGLLVADTLTADLTFHENGTIASEWDALATFRGVSEGNVTRFAYSKPEPLRSEHEAMRDAILGKGRDIVELHEAVATVRVAEAMLESAQSGGTISVKHE
ncbi:MAG TPA: Gfo/Idh/MocA family oxidoreductase [Actinomycetota bacterium]|nr:Gfo/Idh/MocA family oxidoreductase [Candidatus Nanopelagicales bacterium]HPQ85177.1 Gfo/Idh/MocA family oxidoreductase [Actinomycetota bacterium]